MHTKVGRSAFLRLLASVWIGISSSVLSAQARGLRRSLENPYDYDHRVLDDWQWLGGYGVHVYYENRKYCNLDGCIGTGVDNSCPFQSLDLAVRLYDKVGYNNFYVLDKKSKKFRLIQHAYELEDFAKRTSRPLNDPDDRLRFYPNDGTATRPPAPGDLLVYAPDESNGWHGHVAVVDCVSGGGLSVVQQNVCRCGHIIPKAEHAITYEVKEGKQTFRVEDFQFVVWEQGEFGWPMRVQGWVHSDLIKQRLIDKRERLTEWVRPNTNSMFYYEWNRDDTAVYVYLSPELTALIASGQDIADNLINDLRVGLFFDPISFRENIQLVQELIRRDPRLNPSNGVRSVDFTLKYTGRINWVRPWGGPSDGKWIQFITIKKPIAGNFSVPQCPPPA